MESENPELRAEALLLAGQLHEEAASPDRALAVYLRYVEQFPKPVEAAVETHFKIAGIYQRKSDLTQLPRARWNRSSQSTRRQAASARRARASWPAAPALVLAQQVYESFASLKLLQPFEQSLEEKQRRMNVADRSVRPPRRLPGRRDHRRGDVLPRRDLRDFSRALRESERPAGLAGAKLQEYEDALDEEAFPFEEKAIKVHEKNLELMSGDRLYNSWIEKSLARLAAADARPLREGRDQLRLPRIDRPLCVSLAGRSRCSRRAAARPALQRRLEDPMRRSLGYRSRLSDMSAMRR